MTEKKTEKTTHRYSIGVSAEAYDRLRAVVTGSLAGFVDDIVTAALDDPATLSRLVDRCRPRREERA